MTMTHDPAREPVFSTSFIKSVIFGGGFAFALMAFFLYTAGEPHPDWGPLWRIRPLLVITVAGAIGGAFWHFMLSAARRGGWRKFLRFLLGMLLYLIALWLGSVLGLDGTYWD
jgi:hypothetical protein